MSHRLLAPPYTITLCSVLAFVVAVRPLSFHSVFVLFLYCLLFVSLPPRNPTQDHDGQSHLSYAQFLDHTTARSQSGA